MKIAYVAGSLSYTEAGRLYRRGLLAAALRQAGYKLTAVWNAQAVELAESIRLGAEDDRRYLWRLIQNTQWHEGKEAMRRADLVVAVLDGVPRDDDLAVEVAYARNNGKRLIGLSTDVRRSLANPEWRENRAETLLRGAGGKVATSLAQLVAMIEPQAEYSAAVSVAASKVTRSSTQELNVEPPI